MISASGVVVRLGGREVVQRVDLAARDGRVTGLIGPNGSGKSTLLRALVRAVRLRTGTVRLNGENIHTWSRRRMAREVAFVGQHAPEHADLTVREEVALAGVASHGLLPRRTDGATIRDRVEEAIHGAGLAHLADADLADLSGGERQRVAIARAVAQQAPHALLDEPLNHLDLRHRLELMHALRRIAPTLVIAVHDLELAAEWCDHLVLLDRGRVVAAGTPEEVLTPDRIDAVYDVVTTARRDDTGRTLFHHRLPD